MTKVVQLEAWKGKLEKGERGVKKTLTNLMLCLQNVPSLGDAIKYNDFSGRIEWQGEPWADQNPVDVRLILEASGFEPNVGDVVPAIERHAFDNSFDPVREYLDNLKWDGEPRIDNWLQAYMGSPEHKILSVFGAKFLIGAVARIYSPGCQMDNALVFEGAQGAGKTTAVAALFGRDYMISSISDFKSKEASIALQGRWCVEIAELAALKRSDITEIKKFISETIDQYRPVHGKNTVDRPRRCVFIGTTNQRKYLEDSTGNRRFWPVPCGNVDVPAIQRDKDQIWAEAVSRYSANEPWWIEDQETLQQAELAQADRSVQDPWGEIIDAWLDDNLGIDFLTTGRVLSEAIKMDGSRQGRVEEMRIANYLTQKGWTHSRKIAGPGQRRKWGYVRP